MTAESNSESGIEAHCDNSKSRLESTAFQGKPWDKTVARPVVGRPQGRKRLCPYGS